VLLAVEVFLLSCDRFGWLGFREHRGWTVSIALLSVVAALLLAIRVRHPSWNQFSLRTLLVFTLIVALAAAWLRTAMESKRHEREAVAAIVAAGGRVDYDYQWENRQGGQPESNVKPPGPDWLRRLLGDNFFADVRSISVLERPLRDVKIVVANLDDVAGARSLYFNDSSLTDDGLAHVKGLYRLETLYLERTKITDAGLATLQGLSRLRNLGLRGNNLTDAALPILKSLRSLSYLDLKETQISESGAEELPKALPQCSVDYRRGKATTR
jgi:hypothetical protein